MQVRIIIIIVMCTASPIYVYINTRPYYYCHHHIFDTNNVLQLQRVLADVMAVEFVRPDPRFGLFVQIN